LNFDLDLGVSPTSNTSDVILWASGTLDDKITPFAHQIEAENVPDISEEFEIDAVPSFIILRSRKTIAERISGADAPALSAAVSKASKLSAAAVAAAVAPKISAATESAGPVDQDTRFKKLVSQYDVMAFIKGTPTQPRCGFSRQLVELLKEQQVDYGFYNILSNEEVRQGGLERADCQ
jgi:hypothetical protein